MFKKTALLIFSRLFFEKIFVIVLFFVVLYLLRDFLPLFLVTFIFAYLFIEAGDFLTKKLRSMLYADGKTSSLGQLITPITVTTLLYLIFVITVIFLFISVVPKIILEIEKLLINLPRTLMSLQHMAIEFETSLGINL